MILTKPVSVKVFDATTSFFRVGAKRLWTEKWIEAFWVSSGQIKLTIEPEGAVSRISHIQGLQKLLPDYNFQSD